VLTKIIEFKVTTHHSPKAELYFICSIEITNSNVKKISYF